MQTKRQESKSRNSFWSLTLFNDEWKTFQHPTWKLEGQEEIAPDTGKLHYQGMLHTGQVRFSAVKKVFPQAHIEAARDPVALKKYVHKADTRAGATVEDYAEHPKISRTKFFEDVMEYIHSSGNEDSEYQIIHDDDYSYLTTIVNAMIDAGGDWAYASMAVQPITRAIWRDYRQSMWNSYLAEQQNGVHEEEGTEEVDLPTTEDLGGSEDEGSEDSSSDGSADEGSDDGGDSSDQSEE